MKVTVQIFHREWPQAPAKDKRTGQIIIKEIDLPEYHSEHSDEPTKQVGKAVCEVMRQAVECGLQLEHEQIVLYFD